MTIAIFGNTFRKSTITEIEHILEFMNSRHVRVVLSREIRDEMNLRNQYDAYDPEKGQTINFALSVGGDGTFLYTASQIGDRNIPILGINTGHLGFLADIKTDESNEIFEKLINQEYTVEERRLLQVTLSEASNTLPTPFALNEVAITKQELSSMISIETSIAGTPLARYKGDGLIVSTPTGSTAYNLSIGGPIMLPQVNALILAPVSSHSLTMRPMILPDDWAVDLKVSSRSGSYMISLDGRSATFKDDIRIHIEKAPYTIKLIQLADHSFIHSLKEKLMWGL